MTLLNDIMSDVVTFGELKFTLEKWHKGEFDLGWNLFLMSDSGLDNWKCT